MTYEAAVAWSIMRSLLAGALCLGLARVLRFWLVASPSSRSPRLRVGLLILVPFFMPGLVVGYAYRNASLSLVQTPLLNELLYLAIIVAQLTPVVVLALEWLPAAALGPSGAFLLNLAEKSGRRTPLGEWMRAMLAGELPRQLTAAALAALLCFQEVEVATLMQARGWAEWIFTKQAGGVELLEVLPFLVLPVGYGLLLTVPVLGYWTSHPVGETRDAGAGRSVVFRSAKERSFAERKTTLNLVLGIIIAVSWLLVVIWPVESLALGAVRGAGVIQFRAGLWQEIGDALVLGVTVTLGVWVILRGVDRLGRRGPGGRGSRRAANGIPRRPAFDTGPLSPAIGIDFMVDSAAGERARVRGRPEELGPLTPTLSPTIESSPTTKSIVGEREQSRNRQCEGLPSQAARQEPRPPEHNASASVVDRSRPMSPALARERPSGTGRIAHPTVMRLVWVAALLPGLLGSLALGLTIFEICQRLGVQPSYSPVPLVVAMVLFLLPRALAMQAMLRRNEQQAGVFLAESLAELSGPRGRQGAAILWRIRDAGRFWALALLFWWSYLELTLPALLRPAGMAPAPLRLYNFLHYGHIPGLAAMLAVVLAVPVVLLLVGRGLWWMVDGLSTEGD